MKRNLLLLLLLVSTFCFGTSIQGFNRAMESSSIKIAIDENSPPISCPNDLLVYVDKESCGANVNYSNLLYGTSGTDELKDWTILETNGDGWIALQEGEEFLSDIEGTRYQTSYSQTSYVTIRKSKEIDLRAAGYEDFFLDNAPAIKVGENVVSRELNNRFNLPDPRDFYYVLYELRDENHNVIASYASGSRENPNRVGLTPITEEHIFTDYGEGVRYVYFEHGGIDVGYWGGHFGATFYNCHITIDELQFVDGIASGEFFPIGTTTNVFEVSDEYGITNSCSFEVTVRETISPTAIAQDVTIYLDADGQASVRAEQVDNGSTDNCGIVSMTLSETNFTCENLGENTVTLTVADASDNKDEATATVTVVDNIPPVALAQNFTIYLDADGQASVAAEQVDNGSTDNCGIVSMTLSETNFTCEDLGENTVTLTVADASNNTDEATATVTVVDNIPPEAQGRDLTVYLDENGVAGISPVDMYPGEKISPQVALYPYNLIALLIRDLPISPEELDGTYFKVNDSDVHQMFLNDTQSWAYFYVDYNYNSSTPNTRELFGAGPYEFYFFETAFDNCGETEITLRAPLKTAFFLIHYS